MKIYTYVHVVRIFYGFKFSKILLQQICYSIIIKSVSNFQSSVYTMGFSSESRV